MKIRDEEITLGKYGRIRKEFLENHRSSFYTILLLKELYKNCKEIEKQAMEMVDYLIKQASTKGLDIIQASIYANEVVKSELIYCL